MAITFNEKTIAAQPMDPGVMRQRLITDQNVKDTPILLDRLTLKPGATLRLDLAANSVGWLQVLDGEATLRAFFTDRMTDGHSFFLPPKFDTTLTTSKGVSLLFAEIPDAARLDPGFLTHPPLFMALDWTREPVLQSEHDARKRIALVSPDICGTSAVKIEMVVYPAGTMSPNFHHEGADSLIYIMSGRGTAWVREQPFSVRQGEVIYLPDRERHYLKAGDGGEMRFLKFYAPGEFKTVWVDSSKASAWRSTYRDINGRETAQDERERDAFRHILGNPFIR